MDFRRVYSHRGGQTSGSYGRHCLEMGIVVFWEGAVAPFRVRAITEVGLKVSTNDD